MDSTTSLHGPILIFIRGIPGSGKTYLATALVDSIGKENITVLDPDSIDLTSREYLEFSKSLTADGVDEKFHPYRWSRSLAYDAIVAKRIIIWNQAFSNFDGLQKTVVNLQAYAKEHSSDLPVLIVEVEVPEDVARTRTLEREKEIGREVSEENFNNFVSRYVSFAGEGYECITVKGDDDVATSTTKVIQKLQELGP